MTADAIDPGETRPGKLGAEATGAKPGAPALQVIGVVDADQVTQTDLLNGLPSLQPEFGADVDAPSGLREAERFLVVLVKQVLDPADKAHPAVQDGLRNSQVKYVVVAHVGRLHGGVSRQGHGTGHVHVCAVEAGAGHQIVIEAQAQLVFRAILEPARCGVLSPVLCIEIRVSHAQLQILGGSVAAVDFDALEAELLEVFRDSAEAPLDEVFRVDPIQQQFQSRAAVQQVMLQRQPSK